MSLRYMAYMLRMWREESGDPQTAGEWRFSIQDTGSGVQYSFATLEDLDAFLRTEMVVIPSAHRPEDWPANRRAQTGSLPQPDDFHSRIRFVENVVDDTPDKD